MTEQVADDQSCRAAWWDDYQVLALRGLLRLWQRFGQQQIWPDTGLRHIVPIFPYGVRSRVNFDLAFMMRQNSDKGHVRFETQNDNVLPATGSARH